MDHSKNSEIPRIQMHLFAQFEPPQKDPEQSL